MQRRTQKLLLCQVLWVTKSSGMGIYFLMTARGKLLLGMNTKEKAEAKPLLASSALDQWPQGVMITRPVWLL